MFRDFQQERLDGIATSFLEANGFRIDAEPCRQVFHPYTVPVPRPKIEKPQEDVPPKPRIDWSAVVRICHVPAPSFFDLPREVRHPAADKCACGGVRSISSCGLCQRCFKRRAREGFAERWAARYPALSSGTALAESVLPAAPEAMIAAFQGALDASADLETYRAISDLYAGAAYIRGRDGVRALHKPPSGGRRGHRAVNAKEFYAEKQFGKPTLAMMREMMERPFYHGGYWWNTHCDWTEHDLRDLWFLVHGRMPIEKAAARLGRKPSAIVHRALDAGLPITLEWRLVVAAPRAITRPPRRSMAYPYLAEKRPEHNLLLIVNDFIPHGVPGREDACQALLLALVEGTVLPDALRGKLGEQNRRKFLAAMKRENFEMSGFAVGLDDPIKDEYGSDTGQTLMGLI